MYKINTYIISLIIFLAFTEGAISLIGPSESAVRIFRELFIIILFFLSLIQKSSKKKYLFFGKKYILMLFVIAIISLMYNEKSGIEFFLYFLRVLPPILFFWAVIKINFNINYVIRILKVLVIIQIPAILIKYLIIGVSESGGIGTMSIHAGSLSTIFPLFVISFALSFYLSRRTKIYILVIFVYLIFGLVGGKRALIVYTPLVFIVISFFYQISFYSKIRVSFIKQLFGVLLFGLISFYFIARFNPNLNPEQKVWGSFDIDYMINTSNDYNSSTIELGFSRSDAPKVLYSFLTKDDDYIFKLFFGLGPGDIIQSSLNNKYPGVTNDRQLLMHKYGLGYGLRIGVLWTIMQIGILGAMFYVLFILKFVRNLFKVLKSSNNLITKEYSLGLLGMGIIVILDYFTYSPTFFYSGVISNTFFLLAAIVYKRASQERSNIILTDTKNKT
jgi:hypothetical protein